MNSPPFASQNSFVTVNEILQPITQEVFVFDINNLCPPYGKNPTHESENVIDEVRLKEETHEEGTGLEEQIKVEHVDLKQYNCQVTNKYIENMILEKENPCSIKDTEENAKIVIKSESKINNISNLNIERESHIQMLQDRKSSAEDTIDNKSEENEQLEHVKEELTMECGIFDINDIVKTEIVEGKF